MPFAALAPQLLALWGLQGQAQTQLVVQSPGCPRERERIGLQVRSWAAVGWAAT